MSDPEEKEARRVIVFLDTYNLRRIVYAELVEETDEVYIVKAPAFVNQQLIPKQDAQGRPVADPRDPSRPLLQIHTMLVPLVYPEALANPDAGFVIPVLKRDVMVLDGVLREDLEHRYRVHTMKESLPEPAAEVVEERPIDLFGSDE